MKLKPILMLGMLFVLIPILVYAGDMIARAGPNADNRTIFEVDGGSTAYGGFDAEGNVPFVSLYNTNGVVDDRRFEIAVDRGFAIFYSLMDNTTLLESQIMGLDLNDGGVYFKAPLSIGVGYDTVNETVHNYTKIGAGTSDRGTDINTYDDVYISGDVEVDGQLWAAGGAGVGDLAELLYTVQSWLFPTDYVPELENGDVVCINPEVSKRIMECTDEKSNLVVGVVSNSSAIHMGGSDWQKHHEYNVGVAGIVFTKVSAINRDIKPGDLLITSKYPGRATINTAKIIEANVASFVKETPSTGTVFGKAFDFCTEKQGNCTIPVFIGTN